MSIPIGTTFSDLTVTEEIERSGVNRRFMCRCICGKEVVKFLNNLRSGRSTSCGCKTKRGEAGRIASTAASRARAQITIDGRMCHTCQTWKTWDHFRVNRRCPEGRSSNCIECGRWHGIKVTYGISRAEWEQMRDNQESRCALCGDLTLDLDLLIDHDHTCCPVKRERSVLRAGCRRCIRGLLCDSCNRLLGRIEQRPRLASRFTDYLALRPLLERN